MDRIRRPHYSGPMFPSGLRSQISDATNRLRGTIVGVRSGRQGESETTCILTIKLTETDAKARMLLHADVELIVTAKP